MTVGAEHDITDANRRAWNAQRYEAWLSAFESPKAEAARIIADPERILRRLSPYLGQVADKRICNVQGSHGNVAVALAALRAEVMVIDFRLKTGALRWNLQPPLRLRLTMLFVMS